MGNRGSSSTPELREALRKHLNYYFSDENLTKDTYLVSQMDSDLLVDTAVIASFRAIQSKTTDTDLIIDVLRTCENVLLNKAGTQVKPRNFMYHIQPKGSLILQVMDSGAPDIEKTKQYLTELFAAEMYGVVSVCPDVTGYGNRWYVHIGAGEAAALDGMKLAFSRGIPVTMKSTNSLKEGQTQGLPQAQAAAAPQYAAPPPQAAASYPVAPAYMATPYGYFDPQQAPQAQAYGYYAGQQMASPFGMYGYPGQYPQGAYAVAPQATQVISAQPGMYRQPVHGYGHVAPTVASATVSTATGARLDGGVGVGNGGGGGSGGIGFGGGVGRGMGRMLGNAGNAGSTGSKKSRGTATAAMETHGSTGKSGKKDKGHLQASRERNDTMQSASGNSSNPGYSRKSKGQQQPINTLASSSTNIATSASFASSKQLPLPTDGKDGYGDGSSEQQQQYLKKPKKKNKGKKLSQDPVPIATVAKAPELALNNFPALPGGLGGGVPKPNPTVAEWKMADVVRGKASPKRNGNNSGNNDKNNNSDADSKDSASPPAPSVTPPSASSRAAVSTTGPAISTKVPTKLKGSDIGVSGAGADTGASAAAAAAAPATAAAAAAAGAGAGGAGAGAVVGEQQQSRERKKKSKSKVRGGGGDSNQQNPETLEKATPPPAIAPPELGGPIVGRSADDTGDAPKKSKAPKVTGAWGKTNTMAAIVAGRVAPASSRSAAAAAGGAAAPSLGSTPPSVAPSSSSSSSLSSVPLTETATRSSPPGVKPAASVGASASAIAPQPVTTPAPAKTAESSLAPAPTKSIPAKATGAGGGAWGSSTSTSTTKKPSFAEMLRKKNEEAAARKGK